MKSSLRGALCAGILLSSVMIAGTQAASISGQGTWESTLQGRNLDGNPATYEAYYDTALNITWLADANYAGTPMDGNAANSWATNLNINGHTGWRLPTVTDTGAPGCDFAFSGGTDCGYNVDTTTGEMAHMFYTTLGNKAILDTSGVSPPVWGLTNTGPFSNLQSDVYWTGTDYAPDTSNAWIFDFSDGLQGSANKVVTNPYYAWAVHSGDIATPVPAAAWLFGSGLLGLAGVSRKRRR